MNKLNVHNPVEVVNVQVTRVFECLGPTYRMGLLGNQSSPCLAVKNEGSMCLLELSACWLS